MPHSYGRFPGNGNDGDVCKQWQEYDSGPKKNEYNFIMFKCHAFDNQAC